MRIERVMVVAAHPDDEILGCGATLAKLKAQGAKISVLICGEGPTARTVIKDESVCISSREAAKKAAAIIGLDELFFANFPDNKFDTIPLLDIIRFVEDHARAIRPDLVFTHFDGDLNIDHQLAQRAVMTALRPLPEMWDCVILKFEILSSTEWAYGDSTHFFHPNVFVSIDKYLELKIRAFEAYANEMRPWPFPRSFKSIENLARGRGSQCGREAAEAFMLARAVL